MFKNGLKWHFLGAIICIVMWSILGCDNTPKKLSSEQIAKIEQLALLKRGDMVMLKNGDIYMVSRLFCDQAKEKAYCELTLHQEYITNDKTQILLGWQEYIEQTFYQDDPKWAQAAKCYLQPIDCKALLKE